MKRLESSVRRRMGKSFRKKLGIFNYKITDKWIKKHKRPDQVPLKTKIELLKVKKYLKKKLER